MLKLYRITRKTECDRYDIYEGAIVAAVDGEAAGLMHPADGKRMDKGEHAKVKADSCMDTWPRDPKEVKVKLIALNAVAKKPCVILSDFKAG